MRTLKYILPIFILIFFSGCFNKHGVSLKYYSECDEYYDAQGYYHNECGKDDFISYDEMKSGAKKGFNTVVRTTKKVANTTVEKTKQLFSSDEPTKECE
ncbi:MAG: hypothetical protein WC144_02770 [Sulfurimonas sp.]|jgi:hypothetical protein|nr:hypothetical protein [Sulfurimonadaceae bacterium]